VTFHLQHSVPCDPGKLSALHDTAWRISKKRFRTSIYELTGRNLEVHIFTKNKPLFRLPEIWRNARYLFLT
jgi:hypothetical protein